MALTGLLGLTFLLVVVGRVYPQPVTYDQRQEGRVNVQVDVKDVQIVALVDSDMLEDYLNYDYAYDYSDFTVKPSVKPTTAKPSKPTTTKPSLDTTSSTSTTNTPASESSSSAIVDSPTTKAPEEPLVKNSTDSTTLEIKITESTSNDTKSDQDTSTTELSTAAATANSTVISTKRPLGAAEPRKRCPSGFQMRSGRCFKRRHSFISPRQALMKLAPALLRNSQVLSGHLATDST